MDDQWGGLGTAYRQSVGMRGSPCAIRLAHLSGYQVRPVQGQACFARVGGELLVDASVLETGELRLMQGEIATALASALLEREGRKATSEAIDGVARELLIDQEQLISDVIACAGDMEEVERRHPRVPRAWLADALEDLERLELPSNVVPLRRAARGRCGRH